MPLFFTAMLLRILISKYGSGVICCAHCKTSSGKREIERNVSDLYVVFKRKYHSRNILYIKKKANKNVRLIVMK